MSNTERLRGIATQDRELTDIRKLWQQANTDTQDGFLFWLEGKHAKRIKQVFANLPEQWVTFVQKCAAAGLRQALLDGTEVDEIDGGEL